MTTTQGNYRIYRFHDDIALDVEECYLTKEKARELADLLNAFAADVEQYAFQDSPMGTHEG